jgi:hypothetical protein
MRFACMLAGLLMLVETAARAAIVFWFPIAQFFLLARVPGVILAVSLVLIVRFL